MQIFIAMFLGLVSVEDSLQLVVAFDPVPAAVMATPDDIRSDVMPSY